MRSSLQTPHNACMRGNFWGDGTVGRRGVVHTVDTTGRMAAIRAHTPRVCAARCGGVTRVGRREIREAQRRGRRRRSGRSDLRTPARGGARARRPRGRRRGVPANFGRRGFRTHSEWGALLYERRGRGIISLVGGVGGLWGAEAFISVPVGGVGGGGGKRRKGGGGQCIWRAGGLGAWIFAIISATFMRAEGLGRGELKGGGAMRLVSMANGTCS